MAAGGEELPGSRPERGEVGSGGRRRWDCVVTPAPPPLGLGRAGAPLPAPPDPSPPPEGVRRGILGIHLCIIRIWGSPSEPCLRGEGVLD